MQESGQAEVVIDIPSFDFLVAILENSLLHIVAAEKGFPPEQISAYIRKIVPNVYANELKMASMRALRVAAAATVKEFYPEGEAVEKTKQALKKMGIHYPDIDHILTPDRGQRRKDKLPYGAESYYGEIYAEVLRARKAGKKKPLADADFPQLRAYPELFIKLTEEEPKAVALRYVKEKYQLRDFSDKTLGKLLKGKSERQA